MINKKLDDIITEDLQYLVENNVIEHKTLEYKWQLPNNSDSAKKEFLADVSSLPNTLGGDLIIGIKEEKGTLKDDIGITIDNLDGEIARLENIIRDGISPRISVELRSIDVGDDKKVIILRTRASLEIPHRVVFGGHDKFYKRNSNGKYPIDVNELRAAFAQSGNIIEGIKNFRTYRMLDIKTGDTPFTLFSNTSCIVIHILPLSAFNTSYKISADTLLSLSKGKYSALFAPPYSRGWSHRINLDGVVAYSAIDDGVTMTYVQLYRNGIIEAVESSFLPKRGSSEQKILPMYLIENETMKYVAKTLKLLSELEFQPPFYIFLSITGTKGFTVSMPRRILFPETEPITVNELLLPEVIIDNFEDNLQHKLRPVFDIIWNAGGVNKSLNFDDNNNFKNTP